MTDKNQKRIYLSPPHMNGEELKLIQEAFESNFIAPAGSHIDAFEKEFADVVGVSNAVAVSSGTAAMHLALRALDIGPGDEIFTSDLTFIGSVSPIVFQGATPVFIDCDRNTWNMDPDLLEGELIRCAKSGKLPKAIVPTDLYGQCADYGRIFEICKEYEIPVVADSAEAVGSQFQWDADPSSRSAMPRQVLNRLSQINLSDDKANQIEAEDDGKGAGGEGHRAKHLSQREKNAAYRWVHAGVGADAAVYSFNGNKIITTSCGGMLVSGNRKLIDEARMLSQQAREPFPHYEHYRIGYNYRMSNILAAIGRGQLKYLTDRVQKKQYIFNYYYEALKDIPGIEFIPEATYGKSNRWLTVITIDPDGFGAGRETFRLALEDENIESRPVWKPMHMQPVFNCGLDADPSSLIASPRQVKRRSTRINPIQNSKFKIENYPSRIVGGEVAEDLFNRGLCLPSGTQMSDEDLERIVHVIKDVWEKG